MIISLSALKDDPKYVRLTEAVAKKKEALKKAEAALKDAVKAVEAHKKTLGVKTVKKTAPKRAPAPAPAVKPTVANVDRYKHVLQSATAINALLGGGNRVRAQKWSMRGVPMSSVVAVGKSDKVQTLTFDVTDGKFTISTCPNGFLGNPYETWNDKAFGTKPLTTANLKAALKKHGF